MSGVRILLLTQGWTLLFPGREQTLGLLSEKPASLSWWPPSPSLSLPIFLSQFLIAPSLSPTSFFCKWGSGYGLSTAHY